MTSQVFNFLWLHLDFPAQTDVAQEMPEPMPARYIRSVRAAANRHPDTAVALWVDSKRLTKRQMAYLKQEIEIDLPNVHVKDLRDIPAYANEALYNQAETASYWRDEDKKSMIWRQVDAAKILVSL